MEDPQLPPVSSPEYLYHPFMSVEEGFAFIGLTEEWCLSVCLFHEMFGGAVHGLEFVKARVNRDFELVNAHEIRNLSDSEVEDLDTYEDVVDGTVYRRAKSIFQQRLKHHVPGSCLRLIVRT